MLKITVVCLNEYFPETEFHCPFCNAWARFYSMSPSHCPSCKEKLPNIARMKAIKKFRVDYHKGEI